MWREGPRQPAVLACLFLLLCLLALRLWTLGNHVLFDTTEARYGEVARLMLASGDWVTPRNEPGVPFWAKPPLYAWAGAASMAMFGVSEWAVRLPSVVFSLGVLSLVGLWARAMSRERLRARQGALGSAQPSTAFSPAPTTPSAWEGWVAVALLSSMGLFFVSAGAIMTEASLLLCTTGMLCAFWFAVVREDSSHPAWAWAFFAFAGLGMLAKGPVAWVYAGLPLVGWVASQGAWRRTWQRLPCLRGSLLTLALCLPWYAAAEWRTPGYLEYFFIGEHFHRFTQPGWGGDKFGNAHIEPRGTIWLFALAAALPWSLWGVGLAFRGAVRAWPGGLWARARTLHPSTVFLAWSLLASLAFFTLARNIIWTYTLPALPALALLLAPRLSHSRALVPVLGLSTLGLAGYFLWALPPLAQQRSAHEVVSAWSLRQATAPGPLVFSGLAKPPHSAKFYSQAQAVAVPTPQDALRLAPGRTVYLAVHRQHPAPAGPAWQVLLPPQPLAPYSLWARPPVAESAADQASTPAQPSP
jgi:4-amino-4-deoxy-L-arabinose transferase-like glycosyltransferase